jgi:hypothetical protein
MFDGLSPEVESLLHAAKSDLAPVQADASLLEAMTLALSVDASAPAPVTRRRPMIGKVLTAKAAAIAGVLVLSGGVASAATGALPDPVQDTASHAAEHVGLHIPKSDKHEADDDATDDANDDTGDDTTAEHPENHGKDVSTVAHDESNEGRDHGAAVCAVASDGKCKPNADDDKSGQGKSADHRQDGEHATTTTTVNDDNGGADSSDDNSGSGSHSSGDDHPSGESNPGSGHHGSDDD